MIKQFNVCSGFPLFSQMRTIPSFEVSNSFLMDFVFGREGSGGGQPEGE